MRRPFRRRQGWDPTTRESGAVISESGGHATFQELVERHRHLRGEHRRSGVEGATRRHLERDLAALDARIERRLALWVPDEEVRQQWRDHLHHGGPMPPLPTTPPPLVFHGVATDGSIVEVHTHGAGEHQLSVDHAARGLIPRVPDVLPPEGPHLFGMTCRETFVASPESLAALREFVSAGAGEPPWEHAPELLRDGLVDPDFGLTARGRRALTGSQT